MGTPEIPFRRAREQPEDCGGAGRTARKCAVAHNNPRHHSPESRPKRENLRRCANLGSMSDAGTTDDKTAAQRAARSTTRASTAGARCSTSSWSGSRPATSTPARRWSRKIAEVADEANHHPDVDLRYPHLTVSLMSHDVGAITARDVRLARTDQRAGRRGRRERRPTHAPDVLELALDTPDHEKVTPFWAGDARLRAPGRRRPRRPGRPHALACGSRRPTPTPRTGSAGTSTSASPTTSPRRGSRPRSTPAGRSSTTSAAPAFWVLEDPDGNQACICTWQSRD